LENGGLFFTMTEEMERIAASQTVCNDRVSELAVISAFCVIALKLQTDSDIHSPLYREPQGRRKNPPLLICQFILFYEVEI
jgi:hypothetical protein